MKKQIGEMTDTGTMTYGNEIRQKIIIKIGKIEDLWILNQILKYINNMIKEGD